MTIERPEWLMQCREAELLRFDPESRELTIGLQGRNARITFGSVPAKTSITVRPQTYEHHGRLTVELERQGAGVHWHFTAGRSSRLALPRAMRSAEIRSSAGADQPTHVDWLRSGGKLTLPSGAFIINMGDDHTGTYSVDHTGPGAEPIVLRGAARCARLSGQSAGTATIMSPATGLEIADHAGKVIVQGDFDSLRARGVEQLQCEGTLTGVVSIEATSVSMKTVSAVGMIQSRTIEIHDSAVGGEAGRLACLVSESFWSRGGTDRVDVRLVRDSGVVPVAVIGTSRPEDRVSIEQGPPRTPAQLTPAVVTPASVVQNAQVIDTTFTGGGDVELACEAISVTARDIGTLSAAASVSAASTPGSRVVLGAHNVFVGGLLDLREGRAEVDERLHAGAIINGDVSPRDAEASLAVATSRLANVNIEARLLTVTGANVHTAIEDSSITTHQHLHVGGTVNAGSSVLARGDASFEDAVKCTENVRWAPKPWSHDITENTFTVNNLMTGLSIEPTSPRPAIATVQLSESSHILAISTARDITIATFAEEFAHVEQLVIAGAQTITLGDRLTHISSVLVDADASIVLEGGDEMTARDCRIGLGAPNPAPTVSLDSGRRTLEVTRASARDTARNATSPNLALSAGRYVVATMVNDVSIAAPSATSTNLNVRPTGRINSLSGTFTTQAITGRVHGTDRKRATGASLVGWKAPSDESADELDPDTRKSKPAPRGQLIDVDISELNASDVSSLSSLQVLSPAARPLIERARALGPIGQGGPRAYRDILKGRHEPAVDDNIRAEAQRLREIADVVRSRSVSGETFSAAQWAAAHAHALQVKWLSGERLLRWLHRWVGYGVRPMPAVLTYFGWLALVTAVLHFADSTCDPSATEFRCNPSGRYTLWDNLWRAVLLPGGVLRTDIGGAVPYHPAGGHPMIHFVLVLVTGVIVGFVAVATKNYLLRPRSDV